MTDFFFIYFDRKISCFRKLIKSWKIGACYFKKNFPEINLNLSYLFDCSNKKKHPNYDWLEKPKNRQADLWSWLTLPTKWEKQTTGCCMSFWMLSTAYCLSLPQWRFQAKKLNWTWKLTTLLTSFISSLMMSVRRWVSSHSFEQKLIGSVVYSWKNIYLYTVHFSVTLKKTNLYLTFTRKP